MHDRQYRSDAIVVDGDGGFRKQVSQQVRNDGTNNVEGLDMVDHYIHRTISCMLYIACLACEGLTMGIVNLDNGIKAISPLLTT